MFAVKRSPENPIIVPNEDRPWESRATFNISPIIRGDKIIAVYRALGEPEMLGLVQDSISTIGYAESLDGGRFENRRQLLKPEFEWEKYGLEDPRITFFEDEYFIFYTALSKYPFEASGIKVAVARTKDFKKFERHLITPFNAKAMTVFPERVNGKICGILSVNTDNPPSFIGLVYFDTLEQIYDEKFWQEWYKDEGKHTLDLKRMPEDHIEIGAAPILTEHGWLLFYSHIQHYFGGGERVFGIEAVLLSKDDPRVIIGRTKGPIVVPEASYEKYGMVPDIVFPSGAISDGEKVFIYYGATDMVCAMAEVRLDDLLESIIPEYYTSHVKRFENNPILIPRENIPWEKKAVFNPAAIEIKGKIHILYRAMSDDNTSVIGYASSSDGLTIDEQSDEPAYVPRAPFESKGVPNGNSGCEDPRLTKIDDKIYMLYTAYNGKTPPSVAITSISEKDFLARDWKKWSEPRLLTTSDFDDKDAALLPEKIDGKYMIIHRIDNVICADFLTDLTDRDEKIKRCVEILQRRPGMWDSAKIGIAFPPIKTELGWLFFYHGVSERTNYRMGIALMDLNDPTRLINRTSDAILYPEQGYEMYGQIPNVVFPCGAVLRDRTIYIYYGGADSVVCGATMNLDEILESLRP